MVFPIKDYKYEIPIGDHFGAFGTTRKFDIHTGVDLYCNEGDEVFAMEDGEIIAIEWFTGKQVNMPWWNDTQAIAIKGDFGIINYGEIIPENSLKVGDKILEGQLLGWVTPVLKIDKGKVPSTSMLHLELYNNYDGKWALWEIDTPQPKNLLDPTDMLEIAIKTIEHMDLTIYKGKKVLVAVSGGIDSTVSAILMKEAGAIPIAITMKTWDYVSSGVDSASKKTTGCCSLEDINDARQICVDYDIPHHIHDIRIDFNDSVINNFVDEYMSGRTPNPCIMCNTHIKWGALLKIADKLDCEYIVTGHYAIIRNEDGRFILSSGIDDTKDQSYVLWGLPQEVLARTIFPVGTYEKTAIRQMALDRGYADLAKKSESYEICFIPDNNYRAFLSRKRDIVKGNFINTKGEVIGTHDGFPYFTIGQRRGLGVIGSDAYFVTDINPKTNEVTLGGESDLLKQSMIVKKVNTIKYDYDALDGMDILANVRYRGKTCLGKITCLGDETIRIDFYHQVRAITAGQSSVFYDPNNLGDVIGGGYIHEVIK